MKARPLLGVLRLCLFSLLPTVLTPAVLAAGPVQRSDVVRDAEVVSVSGDSWVRFATQEAWLDALREQILTAGDLLKTGDYGRMGILFADGTQIRVSRKTVLAIKAVSRPDQPQHTTLGVEVGEVWSRAKGVPQGLQIETPSASAAIRGTDWDLLVDEKGTSIVTVLEGEVSFSNAYGSLVVGQGEQAVAELGKAPVRTFLVRPRDRVQWVFSYPLSVVELVSFHSFRRDEVLRVLAGVRGQAEANPADIGRKLFLAGLLFDARQWEESRRFFDEVLAAEPENARALAFRGLLALEKHEPDQADAFLDRALASPAGDGRTEAQVGKVGVLVQRGEIGKAAALLDDLEKEGKRALAGVVSSVFEAFTGNFTKALEVASGYASLYPQDERFPILMASYLIVLGEEDKARQAVEEALRRNPDSSAGYAVLGGWYHLQGRGKEGEDAYRRAIELDPTNAGARNGLALVLMEKGYFETAEGQLDKALESAPENPMLWANRGVFFTLIEQLEKAQADYGKALEEDPTHYVALNGLGLAALKEGKTEEAIQYFLKASVLEPRFAQPHDLLAVAYYQLGKIESAMQELELAKQLDPKDPFPHLIAYLIYQDTYQPWDAVQEARQVLDLLPYMKSVNEIDNTKSGLSNLGSALLSFGLADWSESYAQESYNPYDASSHFQSARRYNTNHYVSISELLQGLLLDPLANSSTTRYRDIIRKPFWDLSLNGTWGDAAGGFSQLYGGVVQGYFREPWETSWSLAVQGYNNAGTIENSDAVGGNLALGVGVKPNYQNSFNLGFTASQDNSGQPGTELVPDPDDELDTRDLSVDLGYRHRFGHKNDLLARAAYDQLELEFKNPAPFGTGLTDLESSFILADFGIDETRRFFQQGVYDVSQLLGPDAVYLATDSTGTLAQVPEAVLQSRLFPPFVDTDPRRLDRTDQDTYALQARHLFNLGEQHEATYGVEFIPIEIERTRILKQFQKAGEIYFFEEPILYPDEYPWWFDLVTSGEVTERSWDNGHFVTAYVDDRWQVADWLLLEGGAFLETYSDDYNEDSRVYPRVGMAVRFLKNQVLRLGYQHWLEKATIGTLAPVAVAGLVVDNSLSLQGSRLYDYQARLESRWTKRLFTAIGAERVELQDPNFGPDFPGRQLLSSRATAAVNAIPWSQLGVFLRYAYTEAQGTGGIIDGLMVPGVPDHVASGGAVWISPWYVKVMLTETYVGQQFASYANDRKLDDYWTTGLAATWEPFEKHAMLALSVNNLFNAGDPAPGRSIFGTVSLRY